MKDDEDDPDNAPCPPRNRRRDRDEEDEFDDDDSPRRSRNRRRDRDEEDEFDDDDDDRPRRRRRPPSSDVDDPAMGLLIPVNVSALAMAAGYVGLISVLCFPAPFALLLGILALVQMNKDPKLRGKGRAIFGIVMGVIFTLVALLVLVAMAVSGFQK